jgi:hypothetical protein
MWVALLGVAAAVACGGQVDVRPAGAGDGGQDAMGVDVGVGPVDATATADGPDVTETSVDASFADAWLTDAWGIVDAGEEATAEAADAAPACNDMCVLGDTECNDFAVTCADASSGVCSTSTVSTCVVGPSGCTLWGPGAACGANDACCVPCHDTLCDAFLGQCLVCPAGPIGAPCQQDTDCGANACDGVSHTCLGFAQCRDNRQDGQESDVDCGGQFCGACLTGQRCSSSFDCQAGHPCMGYRCQ